ncbi:MAG: FmdB family transcriptional regulator [Micrococcales bacterium]|nr:FmdB family transcriptional regulator [Micrococcales bacterium]
MPTYSYACRECGHAFDIRQSFTDDSLVECPACHAPSLRKVIQPVGISFKGSGFYRTDSKAAAASLANTKGGSSSDSTSESSSDSSSESSTKSSSSSSGSDSSSSTGRPASTPSTAP